MGKYLLDLDTKVELIEKSIVADVGYIYTSHYNHITVISSWKLIDYIPIQRDFELDSEPEIDTDTDTDTDTETDTESDIDTITEPITKYSNDITKYRIFEFDTDAMVPNSHILIIGKRGTGKSWLVRELLKKYITTEAALEKSLIVAPTDRMNPFYGSIYPNKEIKYQLDENDLKLYLKECILDIENARVNKGNDENDVYTDIDNGCVVLDDALRSVKMHNKMESLQEILMNGRHYKTSVIATIQILLGLTPELRNNFDYVFLGREDSTICKKKLYNSFGSIFPTYDMFDQVFKRCTENYSFMVIDNRRPTNDISDKIFWYKTSN